MARTIIAGISYPFRKEKKGLPLAAKGLDVFRSALVLFIKTNKRSRVMRPTLGLNLLSFIFENTGPALRALVAREIATGVAANFPNVTLRAIDITEDDKTVNVNVRYVILGIEDETGNIPFSKGQQEVA